jgi:hypothetical protein
MCDPITAEAFDSCFNSSNLMKRENEFRYQLEFFHFLTLLVKFSSIEGQERVMNHLANSTRREHCAKTQDPQSIASHLSNNNKSD